MNFEKFAQQLEELTEFFAYLRQRFSAEELSDLDRDVLMDYVRDLYATLRKNGEASQPSQARAQVTKQQLAASTTTEQPKQQTPPAPVVLEIVEPSEEPTAELIAEVVQELQQAPQAQAEEIPAPQTAAAEEVVLEEMPLVLEVEQPQQEEQPVEIEVVETVEAETVEAVEVVEAEEMPYEEVHTQQPPHSTTGELQIMQSDLPTTQQGGSGTQLPEVVFEVVEFEDEPQEEAPAYVPPPPRFNAEYDDLFVFKATGELSQKLAESRIEDLNKAMGLNDKFLYINELFGGNSGRFKQAIDHFNTECRDLDDAREYIERELIQTFRWLTPLKTNLAKEFIKLLRRRYLR